MFIQRQHHISQAMTGVSAASPFLQMQLHRASEAQVHYYVRHIEAVCPNVFGFEKQAFPTDIAEEVRGMLRMLRERAEVTGEAVGPVCPGAGDAQLANLSRTITTDQLDAMRCAFLMLEQTLDHSH